MTGLAIELKQIEKRWGESVAIRGIDISVPAGSFTVLLGPSGCGKSTTLRVIAGLEAADAGQVIIGGQEMTHLPPAERNLAMVFQSYALFPHLTVSENILFGLRVRRVPKQEQQQRLVKTAALLGLDQLLKRKPAQLSGGQQQRVALARAIISEKPICLMDEPLSNLDAKLRHEMRVEIRALQRKLGLTMIYVTHDQVEAISMADQIVLLNDGQVEQIANPQDIYERPATPFAARFIGTPPMNLLRAETLGLEAGGRDTMIGIRPESLSLESEGRVPVRVHSVEYLGADSLIECERGGEIILVRASGALDVAPGAERSLVYSESDLHLFEGGRRSNAESP